MYTAVHGILLTSNPTNGTVGLDYKDTITPIYTNIECGDVISYSNTPTLWECSFRITNTGTAPLTINTLSVSSSSISSSISQPDINLLMPGDVSLFAVNINNITSQPSISSIISIPTSYNKNCSIGIILQYTT